MSWRNTFCTSPRNAGKSSPYHAVSFWFKPRPATPRTGEIRQHQGLPMTMGRETQQARAFRCDPAPLHEYADAVFANMDAYLGSLSESDLDSEIDLTAMGMGKMPLAVFLTRMLLGNTYAHTGEISTLKGLLGVKGYAF